MASSVHRREVIGWMGIGALAPLLGACTAFPGQQGGNAHLDLLYVADTLDARQPGLAVVPATRLGPVSHLGRAPWMTGSSASIAYPQLAPLLDANQAGAAQLGGYAVLAALLEQLRGEAGAGNSLTLENGQGWNGSGLAYLTQGESGVQGSQLLGVEARVSSDERVLWPQRSPGLYRQASPLTLAAGLADAQRQALGLEALHVFERGGARIAVVGVTDPYAQDQKASLKQWYQSLQPVFEQARREADLVVAMADVGTGPGLWLAERLPQIDVLLCARGQDLWPAPVEVTQASGRRVPVLFAGHTLAAVRSACAANVWPGCGSSTGASSRPLNNNWRLPRRCASRSFRHNYASNVPATRPGSISRWPAHPRPCGAAIPEAAAGTACCIKPWLTTAACPCCCRACVMTTRCRRVRPSPANT